MQGPDVADRPERMLRVPKYRASSVDPCREHLRKRRAEDPAVPVQHLSEEIKTLGFMARLDHLHPYINQGRADADRRHICPRRLARILLARPENLKAGQRDLPDQLTAACPQMTDPATAVRTFAKLLNPRPRNFDTLDQRITQIHATDLPHQHAFSRGLERDRDALISAVTPPFSNGPTEGVTPRPSASRARCTDAGASTTSVTTASSTATHSVTTEHETGPVIVQTRRRR